MSDDAQPVDASPMTGTAAEYGISQFPAERRIEPDERERLREEYGWLRAYFKLRPRKFADVQRWLNQARMGVSYDVYLAESAYYAAAAVLLGAFVGGLATIVLSDLGLIGQLRSPLRVSGDLTRYVSRNRFLFAGAGLTLVSSALLGAGVWYARYLYPRYVADARRRNIDVTLPHAITFMYALSYGGMNLIEVVSTLAESEDTYGEIANEFEMVSREVELFGNDLNTALRNTRNLTPSDNLEGFVDDLLAVMDSGGDVTTFFRNEADTYLEEAREEQSNFLETLSLLSEFFVVGFVAAPLFLIVILLVISLLGGRTLAELTTLVYLILPLGMAAFLVLLDTLSEPYRAPKVRLSAETTAVRERGNLVLAVVRDAVEELLELLGSVVGRDVETPLTDDERRERRWIEYDRLRRKQDLRALLSDPVALVRGRPLLSLVFSVPVALGFVVVAIVTGVATPTASAFVQSSVRTTTALVVLPLLVVLIPLSVFHELETRRETSVARRFPDTLNVLSSANNMGIEFTDALSLIARWSRGPIAVELRKVRNDVRWNYDAHGALLSLADRLSVPQLSRTIKLLAEGTRSSSDLARVLAVAAEDTRERFKIERTRRAELSSYVAVVVIGFLVYLLVVVLLDSSYLQPVANASGTAVESQRGTPLSLQNIPVETYRAIFFHSALIQGLGVGLLAGKLARDSVLSGLKYSIALLTFALIAFALV